MDVFLSSKNNWLDSVNLHGLQFRGLVPDVSMKFGDLVEVTEFGVTFGLSRHRQPWTPFSEMWDQTIAFFGKLVLHLPGGIGSLNMGLSMVEANGTIIFAAIAEEMPTDTGFAGVAGLKLSSLTLTTAFSASKSPTLGYFEAASQMELRKTSLDLSGFYTKTKWEFHHKMQGFDFAALRDMYEDLFGTPLHTSPHEVVLGQPLLTISPSRITISGTVTVEGHTSTEATIELSRSGLRLTGRVADHELQTGVTLKDASLDISIGRQDQTTVQGPGTSFSFCVSGTVALNSLAISASLYLDRDAHGKTFWTLMGSLAATGIISLSSLVPLIPHKSWLDLPLRQIAVIAGNVDGAVAAGAVVPPQYGVINGFRIYAMLPAIPAVDHVFGSPEIPASGLTLQATYSNTTNSLELGIQLSVPRLLSFKNGAVYSGPLSMAIEVSTTPSIMMKADWFVKVQNQVKPLMFSGGLVADFTSASLFVELKDQWWENPLGLSEQVKLGPNLALTLGIAYIGPVYPNEIGIAGGLAIGDTNGDAALVFGEIPDQEMIQLKLQNLDISNLVQFASQLCGTKLQVPLDFLTFKDLKLYLSTGVTIGTKQYPLGASFDCAATLFDHDVQVDCQVNKATRRIELNGVVSSFQIGPVSISGSDKDKQAKLDLIFGESEQSLVVNGAAEILDSYADIRLNTALLPVPKFDLTTQLQFTEHLDFELRAIMNAPGFTFQPGVAAKSLQTLDFNVQCSFSQEVLQHVSGQVHLQVGAAQHALDAGVQEARKLLSDAQDEYNETVDAASAFFNHERDAYNVLVNKAKGDLASERIKTESQLKSLNDEAGRRQTDHGNAVNSARRTLQQATETQSAETNKANQNRAQVKADGDHHVDDCTRALNTAQTQMDNAFGGAEAALKSAQWAVSQAEASVQAANNDWTAKNTASANAGMWEKLSTVCYSSYAALTIY